MDNRNLDEFNRLYSEAEVRFSRRDFAGAIKILDEIIRNEDKYPSVYLSQVYTTYSSCLMETMKGLSDYREVSERTIAYTKKALELKPDNKVAPQLLFRVLLGDESRFIEAMEVFAKYNINLGDHSGVGMSANSRGGYRSEAQMIYGIALTKCIELCRSDSNAMDKLYDLHENYFSSHHYTLFLKECANGYGNTLKSYSLINDYLHTVKQEELGTEKYFSLMCEQLLMVAIVGNREDTKRVLKKTDEYFNKNKENIRNSTIRYAYFTNKIAALLQLDEIDTALKMYSDFPASEPDNTVLYNLGQAYLRKQQYENAVRFGSAACNLKEDEQDDLLLAKAYMGLKDYESAIEYLEKGIAYIKESTNKYTSYHFEGMQAEAINTNDPDKQLADFYAFLIQAYVGNKNIPAAKAVRQIAEEDSSVNTLEGSLDSSLVLEIENSLNEDIDAISKEKESIEKSLRESNRRISVFRKNMSKWYQELVKIQALDVEEEITDEDWEEKYQDAFDKIISSASNYCVKTRSKENEAINNRIHTIFPGISKIGQRFLSTAERMYLSFCEEKNIDFAPVMVEYCRTIEVLLKDYLEKSNVYAAEYEKSKAFHNQGATFGAATNVLWNVSGPLDKFRKELNDIRKMRNNSAHINVNREPDVAYLRDYIWNSPLINVLCVTG